MIYLEVYKIKVFFEKIYDFDLFHFYPQRLCLKQNDCVMWADDDCFVCKYEEVTRYYAHIWRHLYNNHMNYCYCMYV